MEILIEYISNIGNQFIDPKKRIFIAYIAISIAIAFVFTMSMDLIKEQELKEKFEY